MIFLIVGQAATGPLVSDIRIRENMNRILGSHICIYILYYTAYLLFSVNTNDECGEAILSTTSTTNL